MGGRGEIEASVLLDLALADPANALAQCNEYLASERHEMSTRVTYLRARGLAHRLLGNLDASASDLEEGLERAEKLGDKQLRAGVALTLAGTRVFQGKINEAKAILIDCVNNSSGEVRAEAIFQLGSTYGQSGDIEQCLKYYSKALPLLRRYGRRDWESNLLGNRGIANFLAGDFAASIRDLDQAIEIQIELGIPAQAAINTLNKAQAMFMMGNLAGSLDLYRAAESEQDALGMPVLMHAQKIETFLAAGMFEDCLDLSQRTHEFHHQSEMTIGKIRALLPGAEAALALGQNALARRLAHEISQVDGADAFGPWIDRAELVRLEAKFEDLLFEPKDKQAALEIHARAIRTHTSTALRAMLIATQAAIALGDLDEALALVDESTMLARKSPLHLQIQRWGLVARVRRERKDRRGTLTAARAGLAAFDRFVAGVSSYDTSVRAGRHAQTLAEIGVRELIERRQFGHAVSLIERVRSGSIRAPRLRDEQLKPLIVAEMQIRTGHPDADAGELLRLQRALTRDALELDMFRPATDESVLTWVEVDGELLCLHRRGRRTGLHRCGSTEDIKQQVDDHRFVHRQLARRQGLSARAVDDLTRRRVEADELLAASLFPLGLRARAVLNPSVGLAGVIWGSLPALEVKPHVIAPSLAMTRSGPSAPPQSAAVLGASELTHVPEELRVVAEIYRTKATLDPNRVEVESIDGADIAHLAGHFVSDGSNPLFSGIPLGNHHLRGTDYLQLNSPPAIAVLSACASGETDEIGGSLVGLTTAALAAGTRTVLATQTLIEDSTETVATMRQLHTMLATGTAPADALVTLRTDAPKGSMAAQNLVVYGAGW